MRKRFLLPLLVVMASLAVPASSQALVVGIGNQNPFLMFGSPYFQQLHIHYARYFVAYDAVKVGTDRDKARSFIQLAQQSGAEPLIAFYHSEVHPTHIPSVKEYTSDVKAFIKMFPTVKVYTPWNEANRGNVNSGQARFHSPSASQAAAYYKALRGVCRRCKIVGLDVLDSTKIASTVRYIRDFKHAVSRLHVPQPSIWGLHNYSDTNRYRSTGTRAVLREIHGQLWLTETGGVVKFGNAFPNRHGEGLKRAAKALDYMFRLTRVSHAITRLYIYQWTADPTDRFDAALMNTNNTIPGTTPRPGYNVVKSYVAHHSH